MQFVHQIELIIQQIEIILYPYVKSYFCQPYTWNTSYTLTQSS